MPTPTDLANAIRALSMDAVQKANSGHPGAPMGMADIAEVLWNRVLSHNPANPHWVNRDRFVLSNGHGSMLLYSLLHLSGYDVSLQDLKDFRQLHSKTPGHPEYGDTPGVETTTGPLGQGLANAVGMAMAERTLASQFNRDNFNIIDHYTYVFMGDGCLMEGISHEVCSLAGTLKLGKLIAFWDDNGISIDGKVAGWFADDTAKRFEAYGWQVIRDVDGHNAEQVAKAIQQAQANSHQPSLICCKTEIGFGSPNLAGSSKVHGAPLGDQEIAATREALNWPHAPFEVPDDIYQAWNACERGEQAEEKWTNLFEQYQQEYPELAAELLRRLMAELPESWQAHSQDIIHSLQQQGDTVATRKASQMCLESYGPYLPELLGGSADLTGSNLTKWSGSKVLSDEQHDGNYIFYGVREFGMSAIMNGMALYGGFIPYGGTFLTFVEYARNAVRMAALMKQRAIFIYSHDSIGLGEDGPTHQPVSQAASLRLTPNVAVWRPCDAVETAVAWKIAIEHQEGPSCLLTSRQGLAHQARSQQTVDAIQRGGYTLLDSDGEPELIVIATGSEVALATEAAQQLNQQGKHIRVVSMPCTDVFDKQPEDYKEQVLPKHITKRLAIEAASADFWYKYVGLQGEIIGMTNFGLSAPANQIFEELGFTVTHVINTISKMLNQ